MSASRLSIYNDALLLCGERALNTLTENREPRYLLDQVWNNNGVDACLEEGQWFFAMRTVQLDYDPNIQPPFGFARAFDKPTDWILTSAVCSDEFFREPLLRYSDEAAYWYSDLDTIYIKYVSNDIGFGGNLGEWPRSFTEFVAAHFAFKIVTKISNDDDRLTRIIKIRKQMLLEAKSKGLMAEPTKFPAQGTWSRARMTGGWRRDGGSNSGSLY